MNKEQNEYDKIVQARNRETNIKKIERSVSKLDNQERTLHIKGQADKIRNRRDHTLCEYVESLNDCKRRLKTEQEKLEYFQKKHQPPKSVDKTEGKSEKSEKVLRKGKKVLRKGKKKEEDTEKVDKEEDTAEKVDKKEDTEKVDTSEKVTKKVVKKVKKKVPSKDDIKKNKKVVKK
jgi:hypothetical protein